MPHSSTGVPALVDGARRGDEQALGALVALVYDELRRLAARYMRRERPGQTLQATALVHDAYLRLLQDSNLSWQNRAHFFGIAARSMRQILIERARTRGAAKRGGSPSASRLNLASSPSRRSLSTSKRSTSADPPRDLRSGAGTVVEVRFFGGLSIEETAEAIGLSPATVKRRWTLAKAWLARELGAESRA
jgi:RNA polymerase sigma factor (TIGR02999 family)